MKILFTNNTLDARSGTELYVRDMAVALKKRGHEPMAFTLEPGVVAGLLEQENIPVVDDLRRLPGIPDIIHGHHAIETTLAAMTFRKVPVISFCHGPEAWQEAPCRLPNVVQWAAVDEACRARLIRDEKIPADRIRLFLNFVDLERFPVRPPLPAQPGRALVFSNYLHPSHPVYLAIASACQARDLPLDVCGHGFGQPCASPERLLQDYDIVFAKARCALEALACGCAVVQADFMGAGRMIAPDNFDVIRPLNFGFKSMTWEPTAEHLGREIDAYDPAGSALVTERIRREASLEATAGELEALYHACRKVSLTDYDPAREAADFLRFQLFLSKRPMDGLVKTKGIPLRLPVPPLAETPAALWRQIMEPHISLADFRLAESEVRTVRAQEKAAALKEKISALKDQLKQLSRPPRTKAKGWRRWLGLS